ncbi:spore germination protein GerPC [Tumebacillus algifaecis]|uniref:spore germination protein GerPC n=1 Tax=Tumebacillus algifaecis TaxID=1214604 RepID=UPI0012FD3C8D|nr:spore germination protein GerPC [Tumebacillus algifaecis]
MVKTVEWNTWEAILQLQRRIEALERENQSLQKQIKQKQRPTNIKKLVYHVHALHIQEMSGTMNIGITAPIDEDEVEIE